MNIPNDMISGAEHETNFSGRLTVVKYINSYNVLVEFNETGYRRIAQSAKIRLGVVKDKLLPSVFGVGVIGVGVYKSEHKGKVTKEYQAWKCMMRRCYDDDWHKKSPTYRECEVCEEWQDFQVFAAWFEDNYPNDGKVYELDKDIKVQGNKIYSPEFCIFVSKTENLRDAMSRRYLKKSKTQ